MDSLPGDRLSPVRPRLAILALVLLIVFSLIVLFASGAFAQAQRFAEVAIVASVDPAAGRIAVRPGERCRERLVLVDADTRIRVGTDAVPMTQLQPGDRVAIAWRRPSAAPVADLVRVLVDGDGRRSRAPVAELAPTRAATLR
jgi:hypothetical protein